MEERTLSEPGGSCLTGGGVDESHLKVIELDENSVSGDYREAMAVANSVADGQLGDAMLIAWYDRDRDFESPQHSSECHLDSAVPGYVDYALNHGAQLKVDIANGRFVFYYLTVEL